MILAVTGITGHSGGFFLEQLIGNHFDGTLRCLVRETSRTAKLDASGLAVEKVVGRIDDPASLRRLPTPSCSPHWTHTEPGPQAC